MAVKEDTDICLNITGSTTNSEKTTTQIVNEMCLKKLNRPSIERVKRPFKKFHAIESSKGLLIGAKKRIKQKSLVTIVSNNLKRANRPTAVPKRSILKKSTAIISHENAKPLSNESSKDLKSLTGKTKSNVQNRKNKCDGTLISFTKNVKDNPIETILAKKRKRDGDKPSQSLSSILKVTDSKKVKFLESNDTDSKFTSEQVQKPEMSDSTVSTVSNIKSKPPDGLKKSRVDKSVEKNYKTKADLKRKNTRSRLHQTGNFFSLFKNNPSVPNIGQRFVKPINEEVFSAEKFSELGIHVFTVLNLEQNMNITTMTTVQKKAIPVILSGSDTLIRSQTGSGKTLSYALPIIENLQSVKPKLTRISGINALVIVPTRELALQTYECFLKLIKPFTWLVPGYLVGGEKRKAEKARLRKGCNILVATPGRLLDHIRHTKALKLDSIKYFVLDEADRMLDMGYEKDISEIVDVLKNTPSESSNLEYDALSMLRQHIKPNADDKNVNENLDNQNKFDNKVVDDTEGMNSENANKQNQYHQLCRNDVEHKNASKVSSNMEYDAISMLRQHAKSNSKTKNVNDNVDSQNKFDNNIGDDTEGMKSEITNKQYQYQFRRNDDQLKNKSKVSNNLEYDALSMLRQHAKSNSKTKNVNENLDNQHKSDNNIEDETEVKKSEISRRQYHSDTDEDSNHESDLVNSKSVLSLDNKINEDEKIIPDISKSPKRQTILLSATLTHAVEKLAGLTMHNPVFVDAAKDNVEASGRSMNEANEDLIVPQSVVQSYIVTPPKLRMVTLSAYIAGKCRNQGNHKILIFMATQDMIDYHAQILSSILNQPIDDEDEDSDALVGIEFFKLHGNMSQKDRTEVFKIFKQANNGVLLCTDVAARGLDLPKVDTVVQYTGPTSTRDYVHRIGRTGRAGSSGTAIVFLTPPEVEFARLLEARRIRIKQDDMDKVLEGLLDPLSPYTSACDAAVGLQNKFEELVLADKKLYAMACKAYTSWVRFYSSYPHEMREVFNRKELHLGHYAKSFALRDPPQKIGGTGKLIREREDAQRSRPRHQNRLSNQRPDGVPVKRPEAKRLQNFGSGILKNVRMLNTSEYDSGLQPRKKPKKP